jgi:glucokinase
MAAHAPLDHLPFPILIGDIGGTNARFALIDGAEAKPHRIPDVHTADFATIDDAIATKATAGAGARPKSAVLAVAGPIVGDAIALTNCAWIVEPKKTLARFGLDEIILLNDFEAQSLCLPDLSPADITPIGDGVADPEGARVVLGPGTGLGAAALVHADRRWIPVPGEGGHVDLGPVTARDFAIWPHLERAHGRISAEALLSGPGLMRLYRGIAAADGKAAKLTTPADVTTAGLGGTDPVAQETLSLFATYLGRFAGDFAMIFMARGGVYLAGGIPSRIAPALQSGAFRDAFVDKEPHRELLETLLTAIVVKTDAALAGIAAFAKEPRRFGVALAGRRWTPGGRS